MILLAFFHRECVTWTLQVTEHLRANSSCCLNGKVMVKKYPKPLLAVLSVSAAPLLRVHKVKGQTDFQKCLRELGAEISTISIGISGYYTQTLMSTNSFRSLSYPVKSGYKWPTHHCHSHRLAVNRPSTHIPVTQSSCQLALLNCLFPWSGTFFWKPHCSRRVVKGGGDVSFRAFWQIPH